MVRRTVVRRRDRLLITEILHSTVTVGPRTLGTSPRVTSSEGLPMCCRAGSRPCVALSAPFTHRGLSMRNTDAPSPCAAGRWLPASWTGGIGPYGSDPELPSSGWGKLEARSRLGAVRAAQINSIRDRRTGTFRVNFGAELGPATITREGDDVSISFDRGLTANGQFHDVPGKQRVEFRNLQISTNLGVLRSAPSRISVLSDRQGRLFAKLDRSLLITRGGDRARFPIVNLQVERTGMFRVDE